MNHYMGGAQENDDDEATEADVGTFVPQAELDVWWNDMAGKYPPDVWGTEPCPAQHPYGIKLMTYFDDDPSKPMRIEVLGSKFRNEWPSGQYAFYVVRFQGQTELSYIHWTSGYEEWKVGWDLPPPSTANEEKS